ncbi:forkhead box protein J1-A-like, partial [Clarias magur]
MLSLSCTDLWAKGSVGLEEEAVSPATKANNLKKSSSFNKSSSDNVDDSLSSLQWLQEFSIFTGKQREVSTNQYQSNLFEQKLEGEAPTSPLAGDYASIGMPLSPDTPTATAVPALPSLVSHGHCPDEVDYKTNPYVKPPYSYATLICMAMQASKKSKITLSCIYKWITDNFCYFRHADPTWQ